MPRIEETGRACGRIVASRGIEEPGDAGAVMIDAQMACLLPLSLLLTLSSSDSTYVPVHVHVLSTGTCIGTVNFSFFSF